MNTYRYLEIVFGALAVPILLVLPGALRPTTARGQSLEDRRLVPQSVSASGRWGATTTLGAPAARYGHTILWLGDKMLMWGGYYSIDHFLNDGFLYYPITDTWTAISTVNAPIGRSRHTAVWTGQKMLVWGGESAGGGSTTDSGGAYDVASNSWTTITTVNAPAAREWHSAIWTGTEMIVWGGCTNVFCNQTLNDGGRYNPSTDTWSPLTAPVGLSPRHHQQAHWTGTEMILWGGASDSQVALFDPNSNVWTLVNAVNGPIPTLQGAGVWTGEEMIVWGGCTNFTTTPCTSYVASGGRFNPATSAWTPITTINAPEARWTHSAVWTGSEMIVWGGCGDQCYNSGAIYNPQTDTWATTETVNAPTARANHKAVWTGSEMLVWGGCNVGGCGNVTYFNTGGLFAPYNYYYFPVIAR